MNNDLNKPVDLSEDEKARVAEKKATCPFIGTAVARDQLPVLNDANNPLASIERVRELGNTGGGDLGDLLVHFAKGNHAFMRGDSGKLDLHIPDDGLFSLEFPGSQGSHPGHSGILQGDSATLDSGRLSRADFDRLTSRAVDGWIKRSDVGHFIAENLLSDPNSKVLDLKTIELLAEDFIQFIITTASSVFNKLFGSDDVTHRDVEETLTKLTGENNLVGSAGEFGLLFAFLVNRPGARDVDDEPAVSVKDLTEMFIDKRLPDGWETWEKSRIDWVKNTAGLAISAGKAYHNLKHKDT